MALVFTLTSFAQSTDPTAPVTCEVIFTDDQDPTVGGSILCPAITDLGPAWTNEDLVAAVSKATGKDVQLPK